MRSAILACVALLGFGAAAEPNRLEGLRVRDAPEYTRVVLDTASLAGYRIFTLDNQAAVFFDGFPKSGADPVGRFVDDLVAGNARHPLHGP